MEKKDDNRPENLQIMTRPEHSSLKKIDTTNRVCFECGKKGDDKHWRHHPNSEELVWVCDICYKRVKTVMKREKIIEERLAFLQATSPAAKIAKEKEEAAAKLI